MTTGVAEVKKKFIFMESLSQGNPEQKNFQKILTGIFHDDDRDCKDEKNHLSEYPSCEIPE